MGILTGLLGEKRAVSVSPALWRSILAAKTTSGVAVSPGNALQVTAVFACVRVLAETVASLPLHVYRRLDGGGKQRAADHYLYSVLHDAPNPEMTSLELREAMMGHLALWGNAYANVVRDRAGRVVELWPLRPDRMEVRRVGQALAYHYRLPNGGTATLAAAEVLHLRGLGGDGLVGYSPIRLARQAVGLALATEEFGARFFGNDARPGGILEHPGKLGDEAHKRLRESWETRHQGVSRAHRVAILEEGMKFQAVGLPPEDAQFLQTRQFQLREIARLYRVPLHMVGDLERATFSNIEHQSIEFVVHTIRPWLVRWEQQFQRALFLPEERGTYFAEFLVDGLLRGDIQSRYAAYATARQNGWLSANDVREMENMNPIPGGDVYLIPLNMIPAGEAGIAGSLESGSRGSGESGNRGVGNREERGAMDVRAADDLDRRGMAAARARHRLLLAYLPLFEEAAARVLRRERNDVGAAARKMLPRRSAADFLLWLEDFYRDHADFVEQQMRPLYRSYADAIAPVVVDEVGDVGEYTAADGEDLPADLAAFIDEYVATFAARHANVSRARLRQVVEAALEAGEDPLEAMEAALADWEEKRSRETARWESTRFNNALAKQMYLTARARGLIWRAFGENCAYCNALNGLRVGMEQWFLPAGEAFWPDGAASALTPGRHVGHPPAHDACDCMTTALI